MAAGRATAVAAVTITIGATLATVAATPSPAVGAPVVTASLVRTVDTSSLDPPIPDPAGIVHLPDRDRFLIADSEVDETPVYEGSNIFETTRAGVLVDRGVTTAYTKEPAGIAYNPVNKHMFVSDDDQFRVYEVAPGSDDRYGTGDDTRTSISTAAFGSTDPEDVTYFPPTGELFVLDGADHDVHRVDPGPNGRFDGVAPDGDDTATEFDVEVYGAEDPEGLGYHPGRGTLVMVDSSTESVYELTRELLLVTHVDIGATNQVLAAGIAVAPATDDPSRFDLYVVDRGVDNDSDPNENDGRLYQLRVDLPTIVNLAPVVDVGRDAPVETGVPLSLGAIVRDDGRPEPATSVSWTRVSGPGSVTFSAPDDPQTTVQFDTPGTHVVRATASDGELTGADDLVVTAVAPGAPLPLAVPVAKAFDDVEQRSSGYADWLGSTLNIPRAGATAQTIGIRFADLPVPPGATITEAAIQFHANGSDSGGTSVQVLGIDQDDTPTFTTSSTTVSSRPQTQASVTWSPPAWTSGQSGAAQRTTDLRTIAQEVVDRPGWRSDNALAFVMTGTGERRASSHDGVQEPVLHLAYTASPAQNEPPVASFTHTCTGLTCSFDATGSTDDDAVTAYDWSFSDGYAATGATTTHAFPAPGTYTVGLTVTDADGATGSTAEAVTVTDTASSPIAFRGLTSSNANTRSATIDVPADARAGDTLLLFASLNATNTAITPPPGWTEAANFTTRSQRTVLWHRTAATTDAGSTVTVDLDSYTKTALQLAAYDGTSATAPIATLATRSETDRTTSHTTPPVTVDGSDQWIVSYWTDKSSSTSDWTPPAGVPVRDETIGTGGGRITALLADSGAPVPTGQRPGLTATTDAASRAATITLALRPETSSPPRNTPPTASFTHDCTDLTCTFDGTASSDDEGAISTYAWTFGGGGSATGATTTHTFAAPGTYTVGLTVTDAEGATGSTARSITVSEASASPIAFRGLASSNDNTSSASVEVPAGVGAGDALLLFASLNATDTVITPPPGWTEAASFVTHTQRTLLWHRTATAADSGSTVTVDLDSYTKTALQLAAYDGASATAPIATLTTHSETDRTTSHTTPAVTVDDTGAWVVSYWADKSSETTDWSPPVGVPVRDETIGSGGGRITALLADSGAPVPTGQRTGLTATTDAASRAATISVVLRPE